MNRKFSFHCIDVCFHWYLTFLLNCLYSNALSKFWKSSAWKKLPLIFSNSLLIVKIIKFSFHCIDIFSLYLTFFVELFIQYYTITLKQYIYCWCTILINNVPMLQDSQLLERFIWLVIRNYRMFNNQFNTEV